MRVFGLEFRGSGVWDDVLGCWDDGLGFGDESLLIRVWGWVFRV